MPNKLGIITDSDENPPSILVGLGVLRFEDETDFLAIILQNVEVGQTVLRPNLLPSEVHVKEYALGVLQMQQKSSKITEVRAETFAVQTPGYQAVNTHHHRDAKDMEDDMCNPKLPP